MKSRTVFAMLILLALAISTCKQTDKAMVAETPVDLLNEPFPEAQEAVKLTMDSILQSVKDGDLDKLISFHAYGPKFTEFKNGEPRNDGAENEKFERGVFGSVTEVVKFDVNDMKIAVFDNVANVTLHTDFHLQFGEDLAVVNEQMTLLFLNTDKGWRIVHEHHSELKQPEATE